MTSTRKPDNEIWLCCGWLRQSWIALAPGFLEGRYGIWERLNYDLCAVSFLVIAHRLLSVGG